MAAWRTTACCLPARCQHMPQQSSCTIGEPAGWRLPLILRSPHRPRLPRPTCRLLDRQLHHQHFGAHWAARPQVPVHQHASAWWQHAGWALAQECGRTARREVPLAALEERRQRRLEYQALYAASHVATPGFHVSNVQHLSPHEAGPGRRQQRRQREQGQQPRQREGAGARGLSGAPVPAAYQRCVAGWSWRC